MGPNLKSSIVESLAENGSLPAEEREAIASAIESELARLLPSSPAWLPEHMAQAVKAALRIVGKLAEPPELHNG